jgi:23S rRNA (cytidine1920-2'-O)/16S rRNA (cytidine1409-2'-O)-methyltransferase
LAKVRADILLVERGLFESRAKARAAIEAGGVSADGRRIGKPSELIDDRASLSAEAAHPWVGRGGLKLVHALDLWPISVQAKVVLDVGASTGGFTDVCLARGAAKVYAVDVGRGQLHPRLAADPRVLDLAATDARALTTDIIPEPPNLVVCDVSFISLSKALSQALDLAAVGADLVVLVKPQFEVGREHLGKGAIVKDEAARQRALASAIEFLESSGWPVRAHADSPITGADGNREYLVWATKKAARTDPGGSNSGLGLG